MPREHLAFQAPAGSSTLAQLNALAGLHARIRLGQPSVTSQLYVPQDPDWYIVFERCFSASGC